MTTNTEADDTTFASGDTSFDQYNSTSFYGTGGNGVATLIDDPGAQETSQGHTIPPEHQPIPVDAATQAVIDELRNEMNQLDPVTNKNAIRLIKQEIERLSTFNEPEYLELDVNKPIRIVRKILVPVSRNPRFNFVGKLLGPGGKSLQSLIQTTRCRIYVLGRGSSREKQKVKEEELLASGEPKYQHFKDPLYVRIEASGTPVIAFQKIAHALAELQYYLQPVKDDIYVQQMTEMGKPVMPPPMGPPGRGRGGLIGPPPRPGFMRPGAPRGGMMPRGRGYLMQGARPPPPAPQPAPAAAPAPSSYVTYPGYDYGGGYDYQQSTPQQPAPQYGTGQPAPPPPPQAAAAPAAAAQPTAATYGASSAYPYTSYSYGYDYSQYGQAAAQQPRMATPAAGGKAPPVARGRGIARPAPY